MRILLPLDGSPLAEYAIGQAANLAQRAKERVELRLLRVVSLVSLAMSAPEYAIPTAITTAEAEDEDYLRQVALRPSLEHLNVTTQVVTSTAGVADTISHEAQEWHADLIVLASHGRSGIARALVGSVARDVVNQSQIPTLIFRLQDEIRSLSQIGRYTILVPLDETPFTEQALPPAIKLAQMLDADLVLFEVLPSPSADLYYDRDALERAERYLRQQCDRLASQGIAARSSVSIGDPAEHIVKRAQEYGNRCELIVMATHARTGFDRFFIGSVADEVFRNSHLALVILHPAQKAG